MKITWSSIQTSTLFSTIIFITTIIATNIITIFNIIGIIITINIIRIITNTTIIIDDNHFGFSDCGPLCRILNKLSLRSRLLNRLKTSLKKVLDHHPQYLIWETIGMITAIKKPTGNELHPKLGNYPANHLSVQPKQLSHHDQQQQHLLPQQQQHLQPPNHRDRSRTRRLASVCRLPTITIEYRLRDSHLLGFVDFPKGNKKLRIRQSIENCKTIKRYTF